MDGNAKGKNGDKGVYIVQTDGRKVEFHNVELAPPSGILGINYARFAYFLNSLQQGIFDDDLGLYIMSVPQTSLQFLGPLVGSTTPFRLVLNSISRNMGSVSRGLLTLQFSGAPNNNMAQA